MEWLQITQKHWISDNGRWRIRARKDSRDGVLWYFLIDTRLGSFVWNGLRIETAQNKAEELQAKE